MTAAAPTDPRPAFTLTPEEALAEAGVDVRSGLSVDEAAARLQQYGHWKIPVDELPKESAPEEVAPAQA